MLWVYVKIGLFDGFKKNSEIKKAYKLFYDCKYQEALECYNQILKIDPNHVKSWNGKGVIFEKFGRLDEALKCHDKVSDLDFKSHYAWYNKGKVLVDLERFDEALECFDKVLGLDPEDEDAKNTEMKFCLPPLELAKLFI